MRKRFIRILFVFCRTTSLFARSQRFIASCYHEPLSRFRISRSDDELEQRRSDSELLVPTRKPAACFELYASFFFRVGKRRFISRQVSRDTRVSRKLESRFGSHYYDSGSLSSRQGGTYVSARAVVVVEWTHFC